MTDTEIRGSGTARPPLAECPQCGAAGSGRPWLRYEELRWLRCAACGGGWLEPYESELERVSQETIEETYRVYEDSAAVFEAVAHDKAAWVMPHLRPGMTVVEIGPGVGALSLAMRAASPGTPVVLFEPNQRFVPRLRGLGFDVTDGDPRTALPALLRRIAAAGRPALIIMDNVLEHVPGPVDAIAALHRAAPPGSRVLVEVPNEKGLGWRARVQDLIRGEPKPPTFPGHINLFLRDTLALTLKRAGGSDISVTPEPIRRAAHIAYLTQQPALNWRMRAALAALNALPVDRMLGVEYWLRGAATIGSAGGGAS